MTRRLRRPAKARACLHQLGRCGFCGALLEESFSVDHLDRNRTNDKWINLCACDGTCHDRKSFYERTQNKTEVVKMQREARMRCKSWNEAIRDMDDYVLKKTYDDLPKWLRLRAPYGWLRWRRAVLRTPAPPLAWSKLRYLSTQT